MCFPSPQLIIFNYFELHPAFSYPFLTYMASSSSSSPATRYDVFLSFRGEDTRNGFIGHLLEALCKNQILTFIDYHLKKGDDIPPSLFTAIEGSKISIIIFSEDYANSKWCLKELAKILQCKHLNSQIVIPVFYGVDPSHIRNQTEKVGIAFDKLKERLQEGQMDLNEVRSHLEEAANMSGWVSQPFSSESKLIEAIVGDVLNKLNLVTMNLPIGFVGISSHVERVETLLCLDSPKFRIVGLWGMGGIGKTTIAEAVFNRIYSRFDGFHFVENVSKEFKSRSVNGLREEIVSKLFEEERLKMGNRTLRPDFITKQLQRKKVLLVLDDLDDVLLAKKLLVIGSHLFCCGSRVLVSSRDKQVLMNVVGDQNQIYEVKGLSKEGGFQLFSLHAFKQNHPTSDRMKLSKRVLSYARGNPLVLVVLGCALFDKSKEDWVSALDGLGDGPFPDIKKVLKISYDALCDQKKTIFLDIASFLVGKKFDFVVAYYEGFVIDIRFKISELVDKSLITISENKHLQMHDLLKQMGRSIESTKRPEERTRIWDLKDVTHVSKKRKVSSMIEAIKVNICSVFARFWDFKDIIRVSKKRKGSSMIEAISVNLSQGERISEFDCSVLARLNCLKFLELHHAHQSKVRFCWERFRGFPEGLRYLRWDEYPQKSLPSNFCVENLIELHMPWTTIIKLWTGKQNIVNLKVINLAFAEKLVEFPDVSEGRNIQEINLKYCESLVKLPSSIQHLPKLKMLNLEGAKKLVEFPDVSEGRNIQEINLNYCKSLVKLPPSIQHLPKLEVLTLILCESVESVPTTFDSKVLEFLDLRRCGGVKMFPQVASQGNMIRRLWLNGTDIREVPSSVELLKGLEYLSMSGCKKLSIISTNICKLKSLFQLCLSGCTNLVSFPEIMEPMESLRCLDLSGCTRLKRLPNDHSFHNLKSLEELHLDDMAITELPSSIQHLICLKELRISGCQNLTSLPSFIHNQRMLELDLEGCSNLCSLPELPSSLERLNASGCVSLKTISSACLSGNITKDLNFSNCFELDEKERRRVLDIAYRGILYYDVPLEMILPWSTEIPQWFCGSQSVGSSLTLKLPMDDRCYRFAFCVVIKPNYGNSDCFIEMMCYVDDEDDDWVTALDFYLEPGDTEHLLLWYYQIDNVLRKYAGREVSFQFRDYKGIVEVTKCGVLILSVEDIRNVE